MDKGWINAKIVTPDEFVNVLICIVGSGSEPYITKGFHDGDRWHSDTFDACYSDEHITDWMPLPNPPKYINKATSPGEAVVQLNDLLSFYVAYESENKKCWRIFTTMHDLDSATGLKAWIEEKESEEGCEIYPTFWKLLKT